MPNNAVDAYLGELLLLPYGMIPEGFVPCDGRKLSIESNMALFSLLGTTYGGDGVNNFALPDLRGRVPLGCGASPGKYYQQGELGGQPSVVLLTANLPVHTHTVMASGGAALDTLPAGNVFAAAAGHYRSDANAYMALSGLNTAGGGLPLDKMMPSMALNWLICVDGLYPTRPLSEGGL